MDLEPLFFERGVPLGEFAMSAHGRRAFSPERLGVEIGVSDFFLEVLSGLYKEIEIF